MQDDPAELEGEAEGWTVTSTARNRSPADDRSPGPPDEPTSRTCPAERGGTCAPLAPASCFLPKRFHICRQCWQCRQNPHHQRDSGCHHFCHQACPCH